MWKLAVNHYCFAEIRKQNFLRDYFLVVAEQRDFFLSYFAEALLKWLWKVASVELCPLLITSVKCSDGKGLTKKSFQQVQ